MPMATRRQEPAAVFRSRQFQAVARRSCLACDAATGRPWADWPGLARKLLMDSLRHQQPLARWMMFDNVFGIHEQALLLRGQRVGVLAANLANVDTPNYKARDFDFYATLAGIDEAPLPLAVTQVGHLAPGAQGDAGVDLKYRNPYQASLDGNTVEAPVEQANFAENSVRYQASLSFINQTIASLQLAISGA